jgi:hypothetical protein
LWIERANWFFYRYLYDFYKPVGFTSYNVIWKRMNNSERINANISVDVIQIDDSTYKIRFTSPSSENIIADLSINYVTKFDHSIDRLQTLHRLVTIEDIYMTTNSGKQYFYNIPESSENYNIGVWIKNGYGEITIKSKPTTCTRLLIKDITINDVLPTYNTLSASSMTDENWKNGINKKYNNIILFNFSEDYFKAINNAEYLYSDQKKAKIINVENKNNQWIWVTIDVDATSFAYPNIIELEDK